MIHPMFTVVVFRMTGTRYTIRRVADPLITACSTGPRLRGTLYPSAPCFQFRVVDPIYCYKIFQHVESFATPGTTIADRPKHAIPALVAWRDAWPRHGPEHRERQRCRDGSDADAANASSLLMASDSFHPRGRLVPSRHLVHGWRPRPRWHGGFRRADDTLAWLQRRLRGVEVRL